MHVIFMRVFTQAQQTLDERLNELKEHREATLVNVCENVLLCDVMEYMNVCACMHY
jgi:hypothetical protein